MTSVTEVYENKRADYVRLLEGERDVSKRKILHDTMASIALIIEYHADITELSEEIQRWKRKSKKLLKKVMYSDSKEEVIERYKKKYTHMLALMSATGVELRAKCRLFREERMVLDFLQANISGTLPENAPVLVSETLLKMEIPNEKLLGLENGRESGDDDSGDDDFGDDDFGDDDFGDVESS